MEKWQRLIRSFLTHILERYGAEEVHTWYFDFWTSPDLDIKMRYWYESMEDFFEFYRATYVVFQEVDPHLLLGSPNFSTISGFPWYEAFFEYCHKYHISPAYLSFHAYGCDIKRNLPTPKDFNEIDSNAFSITNQNLISEFLETLQGIMDQCGFGALSIIVSDCNLNFMPTDLIRDTCYMGPYLAHSTFQTLKQVKALGHWCLSDNHDDAYPRDSLFWGGPGFVNYHGLKKASYNALSLIDRLGDVILEQGENYLLAKKGSMYQLFIYNLMEFDYFYSNMDTSALDNTHRYNIYSNSEDLYLNIMMQLSSGSYYIKKLEVNRNHGSAYDTWGQMGYPEDISKDMENYLRECSKPHMTYSVQEVENVLILDEIVPAHGVMLLEIQKK
jgi:xylan 1,4-beta-xylosidase